MISAIAKSATDHIVGSARAQSYVRSKNIDQPNHLIALANNLAKMSLIAAQLAVMIGAVVLVGYATREASIVQLYHSLPPLYPNAALGFVIGGVSVVGANSPRRALRLAAIAGFATIVSFALLTLSMHAVGAGPTWLEGLWPAHPFVAATTPVAGRPVAEACVAFVGVGVAGVMLASGRVPRLRQGLALGCMLVGATAIFGYMIGVDRRRLGSSFLAVGMALRTDFALFLLGSAVLLARPTTGSIALLTRSSLSAQLARRLVFVAVLVPLVLTGISTELQRRRPLLLRQQERNTK